MSMANHQGLVNYLNNIIDAATVRSLSRKSGKGKRKAVGSSRKPEASFQRSRQDADGMIIAHGAGDAGSLFHSLFEGHMPRETYDFLTSETEQTLTDNVKAMADGWNKSTRYIYQILEGEAADFFAAFEPMYAGACLGGVSTEAWDRKLAFHRESGRKRPQRDTAEAFADKFHGQNQLFERYIKAVADGRLSTDECNDLLDLIAVELPLIETLKLALIAQLAKLERVN